MSLTYIRNNKGTSEVACRSCPEEHHKPPFVEMIPYQLKRHTVVYLSSSLWTTGEAVLWLTWLLSWMFGRLTLNMKITAAQSLVDLQTSKFTINIRWLSTIILKLNTTDPVNGVSITSNTVHSARIWHRRVSYDFYLLIEPCDSFPSNLKSISGEQIIAKALDCKNQYILYAIGNIFRDYKCVCAIMMTRIRRAVF